MSCYGISLMQSSENYRGITIQRQFSLKDLVKKAKKFAAQPIVTGLYWGEIYVLVQEVSRLNDKVDKLISENERLKTKQWQRRD